MEKIRTAKFIKPSVDFGEVCPKFFKLISVRKKIKKATLSVTAFGAYEVYINRKRVGDFFLAPGWTSFKHRLQYQTYDVTKFFDCECDNRIDIWGSTGHRPLCREKQKFDFLSDNEVAILAYLCIEYEDGSVDEIRTDESWLVKRSHVMYADIYNGEKYDYLFMDDNEYPVACIDDSLVYKPDFTLLPMEGEVTREKKILSAKKLIITPKMEVVIDFGQNLTGYVRFNVPRENGRTFKIYHAEVLDKDGNFYTENLRDAKAMLEVTSDGEEHLYKPHFTFMGFRYIKLVGFDLDSVDLDDFKAIAVFSDMTRTGYFECGNALLQRLYENVIWGQRGNFLDVPTDCPQRDERLGWTGDAQVFCKTACINYDANKFFTKWLHDLAADQYESGCVTDVVPTCRYDDGEKGSAAWGDACVIVPWQLYLAYDNVDIIREMWPTMEKWISFINSKSSVPGLWDNGNHYGDWLSMDKGEEECVGLTDTALVATACLYQSLTLMVKMGKLIGEDTKKYEELAAETKRQFGLNFLHSDKPEHQTQTAKVLEIYLDLTDDIKAEGEKLVELIQNVGHLTTGFVGTPYLLHALTKIDRNDVAYDLLFKESFPSWLYPVTRGATTIWERWNGIKPDGSFATPGMNSFNHYAYGCVMDWVYTVAVGISVDESRPGYERIIFNPHPEKRFGYAEERITTKFGVAKCRWEYCTDDENVIRIAINIPQGSTGVFILDDERTELEAGEYIFYK